VSYHKCHVRPPNGTNDTDGYPADILITNFLRLPPTIRLRLRHSYSATAQLGLQHTLTLNERPRQQPDPDPDHPPVDKPSIVPQPAGIAPRRRGYVHVRDVRTVQDDSDRARVK